MDFRGANMIESEMRDRLAAKNNEIDRLRAVIANLNERSAQYERDSVAKDARIAVITQALETSCANVTNRDARIAELEAWKATCQEVDCYRVSDARAELAEAKIAEAMDRLCYTAGECDLVTACEHWVANFHETEARAERAEAALSFYAGEKNWHTPPHCYSAAVRDCGTKARTALDHSLAGEKL